MLSGLVSDRTSQPIIDLLKALRVVQETWARRSPRFVHTFSQLYLEFGRKRLVDLSIKRICTPYDFVDQDQIQENSLSLWENSCVH